MTVLEHEPNSEAEGQEAPLLPVGNPLRARGVAPLVAGSIVGVVTMSSQLSPRWGVLLGAVASLLVVFGILDLAGTFDDPDERCRWRVELASLAGPTLLIVGASLTLAVSIWLAVDGRLPRVASALVIPASLLAAVAGCFWWGQRLGPWRLDERGERRSLWRRHGFWLWALGTLLYLPMLGNKSLIDPWETHYGEVAREVLARGDWTSLWWAQDGWFWSKPVLTVWLQALFMAPLGVRYQAGQMLSAVAEGREPQPEWAMRLPIVLLTLVCVYLLYKGVARSHGRRAGFLGGLVLLTMPQFFFLAQQTMTDMPFVAPMAAAVGLFVMGTCIDADEQVPSYELALGRLRLRLSLYHVVMGAILMVVVPQILYLFSRNLSLGGSPFRVDVHRDWFASGSPGNCGLPGNAACKTYLQPVVRSLQPLVQALLWIQALALLMWMSWGERRRQRLVFLAAWLFASLATMAKGPAGIGLPVLAALAYVAATHRWRDMTRMEIVAGTLVFCATVLPWFVAVYARHGQPFVDRLLFHDMFKRAFEHVHDTNKGDDLSFRYYLWQLGYALFPWTGLVPFATLRWLRRRASTPRDHAWACEVTLASWFILGFALFTLMGTKFHHYSLPLVPPLAMLTGIWLDAMWRERRERPGEVFWGPLALGAALLTLLVGRDLAWTLPGRLSQMRLLHLFTYNYDRPWPATLDYSTTLWVFTVLAVMGCASLVPERLRRVGVVWCSAVGVAFAAWCLDVYFVGVAPHWGQRELVLCYEHERLAEPGPLVAYQLNWKGENFYRGNQLPVFVSSGSKFQAWIDEQKKAGEKVFYFVTEHRRISTLAAELGSPPIEDLTDEALNNKFRLVRARFP